MELRKDYVLLSSDARTADSLSTTDFTVKLTHPLENVVKTDIVQLIMDYKVANIVAPDNTLVIGEGSILGANVYDIVTIPGTSWGMSALQSLINGQLASGAGGMRWFVGTASMITNLDDIMDAALRIVIQFDATGLSTADYESRVLTADSDLSAFLGIPIGESIIPSLYTADGTTKYLQWVFPSNMDATGSTTFSSPQVLQILRTPGVLEPVNTTITIEQGLYTPQTLEEELNSLLDPAYVIQVSLSGVLTITYPLTATDDPSGNRTITVSSSTLRKQLGMRTSPHTLNPTYDSGNGPYGTFTWTFPRPMFLSQTATYLLLQSTELGTDIITATGDTGFYRLLLADPRNSVVTLVNNRVDTYLHTPRRLQNIDIRVMFPDRTVVNNRGGSLTILLEVVRSI